MNKTIVFLGPTLSITEAQTHLPDAIFLPPIQCGDIIRQLSERPKAMAIIDGCFEQYASVWHKEILLALDEGIPVYGASSMGALRAAELADFGMIGVGKIFDDFFHERLRDDDEVTVIHGPAQDGFKAQSDAMVNIRATLSHALSEKIISPDTEKNILHQSKKTFFKERRLLPIIRALPPSSELNKLEAHLNKHGLIDQKRLDAIALLNLLKQPIAIIRKNFHFEHSLPLKKLEDLIYCEPAIPSADKESLQCLRLFAYTLKTFHRLCEWTPALLEAMPSEKIIKQLCLLLKIPANNASAIMLHEIAIKFECIQKSVSEHDIILKPSSVFMFEQQLYQHFKITSDLALTRWETQHGMTVASLVPPFFILTELMNRSGDLFLALSE